MPTTSPGDLLQSQTPRSRHECLAHTCTQWLYDYWFTITHFKECNSYQAPITRLLFTSYSNSYTARDQWQWSTYKRIVRDGFSNNCTYIGEGFLDDCEDIRDGLLWLQATDPGEDELLQDHVGTSRTSVGYGRTTYSWTNNDVTDCHEPLPDTDKLSMSPCMHTLEITSCWWGGCATDVLRNRHLLSTSAPHQWYSLQGSCYDQKDNTTIEYRICLLQQQSAMRTTPGFGGSNNMIITSIQIHQSWQVLRVLF